MKTIFLNTEHNFSLNTENAAIIAAALTATAKEFENSEESTFSPDNSKSFYDIEDIAVVPLVLEFNAPKKAIKKAEKRLGRERKISQSLETKIENLLINEQSEGLTLLMTQSFSGIKKSKRAAAFAVLQTLLALPLSLRASLIAEREALGQE